jgi:UDP-N-acetylglucosamine 4,6-dehydratase
MNITITGGSGFLGEKLVARLINHKIKVVSRNEGQLVKLKEKYPQIEIITGDIADEWTARKAVKGADEIYHLAAFKHVGLAEKDTYQCVSSNVLGSIQIIKASLEYKPKLLLGISTDKASQVNGVYGATKFLMERLFSEAERLNKKTKYRIVRYGNVIGSTGSFLTKWKDKMKKGEEVILTDPNATRFFWTVEEAVDHIFECIQKAKNSKPYIPKMKGISMGKVLEACQEKFGNCPVKTIGLQPGENLHETMDGKIFSNQVEQYTKTQFIKKFL